MQENKVYRERKLK